MSKTIVLLPIVVSDSMFCVEDITNNKTFCPNYMAGGCKYNLGQGQYNKIKGSVKKPKACLELVRQENTNFYKKES